MTDNWIFVFPNPKYPGKVERAILVDLDGREPLAEEQADALNLALSSLIKEREELNEHIRKVTQRLVLSSEVKVKEGRDSFITREGAIWEVTPSGPCPNEDSR